MHRISGIFLYPESGLSGYPAGYRILKIAGYPAKLKKITTSLHKNSKNALECLLERVTGYCKIILCFI
jgi:hypothetical protein